MCFSATASFVSGTVLGAVGIASLAKANEPKKKLFAAIPLMFSIQQLVEGFVWLYLSKGEPSSVLEPFVFTFLLFALILWPVWIGASVILFEEDKTRKIIQMLFLGGGLVFSFFSAYYMMNYPVSAKIDHYHILYVVDFPNKDNPLTAILYFGATVGPLLASSVKKVPVLGVLIFISYVITKFIYDDYVISVWCFFAAVVSGVIYLMVTDRIKSFNKASTEVHVG